MKATTRDRILTLLLDKPEHRSYGYEVIKELGVGSGSAYPAVYALRDQGLLALSQGAGESDGPPRTYYTLTGSGVLEAEMAAERVELLERQRRRHTAAVLGGAVP